ncbi:unnamed protein product [Allacma fusca]|uniref:Uncharacterized protein n=1 Tax=Allacma fusca TaxID=39272 RepID=A0A8J2P3A6_9HEXA|nr:unnamed protein product [Allacma fusca]
MHLSYNSCSGVGEKLKTDLPSSITEETSLLRMSPPWIIDLEKSYEIGFAHQFGHLKYIQNRTVPNHNIPRDLKANIQDMVRNPMVRLFSGENLTDQSKDYHVGQYYIASEKNCHYHPYKLEIVKSAETFGTIGPSNNSGALL